MKQYPFRRDPEYECPAPWASVEFAASSSCSYLDIFHYTDKDNKGHFVHEEGILDDIGLSKWAKEDPTQIEDAGGRVFLGGLRPLFGVCGFNLTRSNAVLPFTKSALTTLELQLCIPEQFLPIISGSGARAFTASCLGKNQEGGKGFSPSTCFVFRCGIYRPNFYQLVLSYDPKTRLTYGILFAKTKDHEFPSLIDSLMQKERYCIHPLLLASLVIDLVINSNTERIQLANWRLNELEETMGQHEYVNRPIGNPLEMDFVATTRTLNATSKMLGVERMRLGSNILALEMIAKETSELEIARVDGSKEDSQCSQKISELAAYQINACQNSVLRADYLEKRVQSRIAVVYQFMAQKDSRVNISLAETSATIARESKKDSSSMKAIAVLTMCFLPGTFLAAIFAMPLFNWEGDGLPVVKQEFRYYWAIAIPLTVLVLLMWLLAMQLPWRSWYLRIRARVRRTDFESPMLGPMKDR